MKIPVNSAFTGIIAEKGGFEPPVQFPVRQFSKLLVSATHPPLQFFYPFYRAAKIGNTFKTNKKNDFPITQYHVTHYQANRRICYCVFKDICHPGHAYKNTQGPDYRALHKD